MQRCGGWKLKCHSKLMASNSRCFHCGVLPLWTVHSGRAAVSIIVPQRFDAPDPAKAYVRSPPSLPLWCPFSLGAAPANRQYWHLSNLEHFVRNAPDLDPSPCILTAVAIGDEVLAVWCFLTYRWDEFKPRTVTHGFNFSHLPPFPSVELCSESVPPLLSVKAFSRVFCSPTLSRLMLRELQGMQYHSQ